MRVLLSLALIALALGWSPPAEASHANVCNALPTSATRVENQSCNPRQECQNAAGNNQVARGACNVMPTSGQCPRTVNFNPRADCVAKLPAPPTVSIASVTGGVGGGDNTWPDTNDIMKVQGHNVGLPGTALSAQESGFTVGHAEPSSSCTPPDCVRIRVSVGAANPGDNGLTRHFKITAPGGHSTATGTFHIVKQPAPQQTTTYRAVGGTGSPAVGGGTPRLATGTSSQSRSVSLQIANCSPSVLPQGGTSTCQILAKVDGPALPNAVQGSVAESMPGVHYINISPSSFTVPTSAGSSMLAVGTVNLTAVPFNDPNQSPGRPAPGSAPYQTTAPFRAWVVYPESSGSGTKTAEAVAGIIVQAAQ